jgi:hypothetical protein
MATHRDSDGALRTRANIRLIVAAIVSLTATDLVTARHPLDGAVSAYHHGANTDKARWRQLMGEPEPPAPLRRPARCTLHVRGGRSAGAGEPGAAIGLSRSTKQ